jgi:hypothetical protein
LGEEDQEYNRLQVSATEKDKLPNFWIFGVIDPPFEEFYQFIFTVESIFSD